jgi:hypothetical protein
MMIMIMITKNLVAEIYSRLHIMSLASKRTGTTFSNYLKAMSAVTLWTPGHWTLDMDGHNFWKSCFRSHSGFFYGLLPYISAL